MPDDTIPPDILAMNIASAAAGLAAHWVHAEDDGTGVYRDACIDDIASIRAVLDRIESQVLARPARKAA